MSLVQTAVSTGETTPPTTQKYIKDCLPTEQEKLMSSSADTKILDRSVLLSGSLYFCSTNTDAPKSTQR